MSTNQNSLRQKAPLLPLNELSSRHQSAQRAPRVIEVDELFELQPEDDILVVDVRAPEQCIDGHIPGAVLLPYENLVRHDGRAEGLPPAIESLTATFSSIGLHNNSYVVAYDDDNGSRASRLLWLLDTIGHGKHSLLNGGFAAWDFADHPISDTPATPVPSRFEAVYKPDAWVEHDDILTHLGDASRALLDVRSSDEFAGNDTRANRSGHIPGAVHLEWSNAIDWLNDGRMHAANELRAMWEAAGLTPELEIVVYCHTHHRSSHSYIALKHAGFPNVRAYPGSWSEWGNRDDTPVAVT